MPGGEFYKLHLAANGRNALIGYANSNNIVFGCTLCNWNELSPEQKKALEPLEKEVKAFLAGIQTKIKEHRIVLRNRKQDLEKAKNDKYTEAVGKDDLASFATYLMKPQGYVEQLRNLGLSVQEVALLYDAAGLAALRKTMGQLNVGKMNKFEIFEGADKSITVVTPGVGTWGKAKPGFAVQLISLITNPAEGYTLDRAGSGRDIYRKKLHGNSPDETQYVQDDDGIYTRRYGVMYKTQDFVDLLVKDGSVAGKYVATAKPLNWDQVQPFEAGELLTGKPRLLDNELKPLKEGAPLSVREALHVHQELGSRDSARGVCLTSVSLTEAASTQNGWKTDARIMKKMYANNGTPFQGAKDENRLILVDLSRVPKNAKLLYNLYRPDAQAKAEVVKMKKLRSPEADVSSEDSYATFLDNEHMLNSVTKNREIFLRILSKDYIVNWAELQPKVAIAAPAPAPTVKAPAKPVVKTPLPPPGSNPWNKRPNV